MTIDPGLFGPPRPGLPPTWPEWFQPGKNTPATQIDAVARGVHPMGQALLKNNAKRSKRCGNCHFRFLSGMHSKKFPKCAKMKLTHGAATDVRAGWPACISYRPGPKRPVTLYCNKDLQELLDDQPKA